MLVFDTGYSGNRFCKFRPASTLPLRCETCYAYMNPYCNVSRRHWKCALCENYSSIPPRSTQHLTQWTRATSSTRYEHGPFKYESLYSDIDCISFLPALKFLYFNALIHDNSVVCHLNGLSYAD